MGSETTNSDPGIGQRFKAEMREYLVLSFYLWVCFTVILLYGNAVAEEGAVPALSLSAALVKALIFGKFILIGRMLKPGARIHADIILKKIAWKSLAMLAVLVVFKAIEEIVVGLVHDVAVAEIIAEFGAQPSLVSIAHISLMLLILIPLITFEEVDNAMGTGALRKLLFSGED